MNARRFWTGCAITVAAILLIVVVGGVVAYKRLTVSVPLPDSARLIDDASVGHAVLHLDPSNPWISEFFSQLSKRSPRERQATDLFPIELVWSARRASPSTEGHIVSMSFSPRGRFFGMVSDLMLWRLGRSGDGKFSRIEYGGEGITAFPGTPFPGSVFVRGSSIVWSSDSDTARHAVDMVVAREQADSGGAAPSSSRPEPEFLKRMPPAPHALAGAISGESGAPARCLRLLPGGSLDMPDEELARADLSFAFDATSGDEAAGEIALQFPDGTPTAKVETAAADLANRLAATKWGKVTFEATPKIEPARGLIDVKVTGLSSIYGRLFEEGVRWQRTMERTRTGRERDSDDREPADPN